MSFARRETIVAASAGALLVLLSLIFGEPAAYLQAYVFWTGISLGSLALLMVHRLTGGAWIAPVAAPLHAALTPLPLMALLFIPLALHLPELYPWSRPEIVAHDELLRHKQWYLNDPFFLARAALYFVVWLTLAAWLRQSASREDARAQGLSAIGLILLVFTISFAAIDWIMSLTPEWYSTVFGLLVGLSQTLSAMAFVVVCSLLTPARGEPPAPERLHDLGNLLLMFTLTWAYLTFMQFITVWSANLPEEIIWYLPRMQTDWRSFGIAMVVFLFIIPFLLLLSRRVKRNRTALLLTAALMCFGYWMHTFWLVIPSVRETGAGFYWTDLGAWLGIGGLWLAVFASVRSNAPWPARDSPEVMEHG